MVRMVCRRSVLAFFAVVGITLWIYLQLRSAVEEWSTSPVIVSEPFIENSTISHKTYHHDSQRKFTTQVRPDAFDPNLPIIYVITPTYARHVQKAELTNMCSVMKHTPNILWIVVEDSVKRTDLVSNFLSRCSVPSVHMNVKSKKDPKLTQAQRNLALRWIRENVELEAGNGVIFFADDDNTYDPEIFNEMRHTKGVSVWPVGLAGQAAVESPIVRDGKVVDWVSGYDVHLRKFPVDMSGFAVNVRLLALFPEAHFALGVKPGHLESKFIESFKVSNADLEPKADNCTKILVWHTQTVKLDIYHIKLTKNNLTVPNLWQDI